jgi:excisionase family DNA binding protein
MAIVQDREYFTVAEAARELGVSPSTIWRWIDAGKLPAIRVGSRTIRVRKDDLEAMVTPARRVESNEGSTPVSSVVPPPTPEVLASRRAAYEQILANRDTRSIAPLTSVDLIRQARASLTSEERAAQHALVTRILERQKGRSIAPLTTADLIRQVRDELDERHASW